MSSVIKVTGSDRVRTTTRAKKVREKYVIKHEL